MKGSVEPWFKHRFSWCCFLLVRHQSLLFLFVMCKKQINLKPCALFFPGCWFVESVYQPIYWISSWSTKNRYFWTAIYFLTFTFSLHPKMHFIWASFDVGVAPWIHPTLDFPLCKVALYQLSWADPASVGLVLSVKAMVGLVCHRGSVVYLSLAPHL